ncbi:hypothetical protein HUU53_03935 [Candidatus Micrarchaeota archaeon]|nr:hypothetical protein [Candidatus Micrarchaeota archaeon]
MLHLPHSLLAIVLGIILAFFIPQVGLVIVPYALVLIGIINLFSFSRINVHELIVFASNKRKVAKNLFVDFFLSSGVAFILGSILPKEQALALFIVAVMPTAAITTLLTREFHGEVDEAMGLTLLSFSLVPFFAPLLLFAFYGEFVSIEVLSLAYSLIVVIVAPMFFSRLFKEFDVFSHIKTNYSKIVFALLLLLSWGLSVEAIPLLTDWLVLINFIAASAFFTLIMAFLGSIIGSFKKEKIAFALTASIKSTALGSALALVFLNATTAGYVVVYGLVSHVLLVPLYWFLVGKK